MSGNLIFTLLPGKFGGELLVLTPFELNFLDSCVLFAHYVRFAGYLRLAVLERRESSSCTLTTVMRKLHPTFVIRLIVH